MAYDLYQEKKNIQLHIAFTKIRLYKCDIRTLNVPFKIKGLSVFYRSVDVKLIQPRS